MQFTLDEIMRLTGARLVRWPQRRTEIRVQPIMAVHHASPDTLYFSKRRVIRRRTLRALVRAGCPGVVLRAGQSLPSGTRYASLGVLSLERPVKGFFALAAEARARSSSLVVGITGSAGKSSTKEYLAAILRRRYRRVLSTVQSGNTPPSCAGILLRLEGVADEAAVIEMGFGRLGAVDRMGRMARPHVGVITNVTRDHVNRAGGSWTRVVREKAGLARHMSAEGMLAIHAEDPGCRRLPLEECRARVRTFGEGPDADLGYEDVACDELGTTFTLRLGYQGLRVRLKTRGAVQAANAAAAALVAHGLGIDAQTIVEGLEGTEPLSRRFAVHRYERGLTVIDDSFNCNMDSLMQGLESVAGLAGERRRVAVLAGMRSLGRKAQDAHRTIGAKLVACGFSELHLLFPDKRTEAIRAGAVAAGLASARVHLIAKRRAIPRALLAALGPDTVFYCKTMHSLRLGPSFDAFRAALPAAGYAPLAGGELSPRGKDRR